MRRRQKLVALCTVPLIGLLMLLLLFDDGTKPTDLSGPGLGSEPPPDGRSAAILARPPAEQATPLTPDEEPEANRRSAVEARAKREPRTSKVSLPVAPPQVRVERRFTLELFFEPEDRSRKKKQSRDEFVTTELAWTFVQSLRTTDLIPSHEPDTDFERKMSLSCSSDLGVHWSYGAQGTRIGSTSKSTGQSPLSGRKLLYRREVGDEWNIRVKRRKRTDPSNLTSSLRASMDLGEFGPPNVPYIGDQWLIEDDALCDLFQPGGDLRIEFHEEDTSSRNYGKHRGLEHAVTDYSKPRGNLLLTATGVVSTSGRSREGFDASLEVVFENEERIEEKNRWSGQEVVTTFLHRLAFTGEGKGTWDQAAGMISELGLTGELVLTRIVRGTGIDEREVRCKGTFELRVVNQIAEGGR